MACFDFNYNLVPAWEKVITNEILELENQEVATQLLNLQREYKNQQNCDFIFLNFLGQESTLFDDKIFSKHLIEE